MRAVRTMFLGAALLAAAFAGEGMAAPDVPGFYTAPAKEIAGPPGSLIRVERWTGALPADARAWRILYRSRGLRGEAVAVSALLVAPAGAAPVDGRPVIAWQHPTTGVVRGCAPSLVDYAPQTIMGLPEMLRRGYAVVATDYPGLGTPGPHPYLVAESEGRAALDAVRAARAVPDAHAGRRFALWGHSQGGHASLAAARMARRYAPELKLAGVAVAGPATDLSTLLGGGVTNADTALFAAMVMSSWARIYGAPLGRLVTMADRANVAELGRQCFTPLVDSQTQRPEAPLPDVTYRMRGTIGGTEPWASIAARNSAGVLPADVPVFLAQGGGDTTIPARVTAGYMQRLCKAGSAVRMLTVPGVIHSFIARDAAGEAVGWIADRFDGKPAPSDCR